MLSLVAEMGTPAPDPGLCADCVHSRLVTSARSAFWLCRLSATDPRFPRYPRLPVLECAGYVRRSPGPAPRGRPEEPPPGQATEGS
jgi:hypothetical protein